ncbi:MAG: 30S ribosomal protein S20 [Candidatus Omnitrophica bacterium]|nr:30S ribosomal protein S20 [Candidatus Omnitrophota bacterium]
MPQIKSAFKNLKQNRKRYLVNKGAISEIRTLAKKVRDFVVSKDAGKSETALREYEKHLMKAAQKGTIKKENASRKISRLRKQIHALTAKAKK